MPVLSLRLGLAQVCVGARTVLPGRCGRDWDMVPVAGHPLLGVKLHAPVNELSTALLRRLLPVQLLEGIPCTGTLLLCLLLVVVRLGALEHVGRQMISQWFAERYLRLHRPAHIYLVVRLLYLRNNLLRAPKASRIHCGSQDLP